MGLRAAGRRLWLAGALGVLSVTVMPGCKSSGPAPIAESDLPTYGEIAERHNARVGRLSRLWSLATISMTWTEESGKKRWEQGNGHLQHEAPMRLALSIGKLGETLFWLGTNEEQYWIIDLQKARRAYIGSHELLTDELVSELGLAMAPAELPMLLGIRPLPEGSSGRSPTVRAGADGGILVTVVEGRRTVVYTFEVRKLMPRRIEVLDASSRLLLTSELRNDEPVTLAGQDAFFPEIATLIDIRNEVDASSIKVTLSQMSDRKINPVNFDLSKLIETLGVMEFVDLDAPTVDEAEAARQRTDL